MMEYTLRFSYDAGDYTNKAEAVALVLCIRAVYFQESVEAPAAQCP